jgi:hypothetical protein
LVFVDHQVLFFGARWRRAGLVITIDVGKMVCSLACELASKAALISRQRTKALGSEGIAVFVRNFLAKIVFFPRRPV